MSIKKNEGKEEIRVKVGTVMRGGYSQIRGKGIGIAVVEKDKVEQNTRILLMKNVNSMSYIPVICKLK
jgi:glycine cleavage system aminomethyltransferase T